MQTDEELLLQKIMREQDKSTFGKEYLVRGATTKCDQSANPLQLADVKILPDHGKFILGKPVLSAYDTNIYGFGRCGLSNQEICQPLLSKQWLKINEKQSVFDQNVLSYTGLPTTSSYLICTKYGTGKITVVDSGQPSDKKVDIPPNVREVKEDTEIQLTGSEEWIKFIPTQKGHYNINLLYNILPAGISLYEAVNAKKMKLLSQVEHYDYRPTQVPNNPYYKKRIEHWLEDGKTYYITIEDIELNFGQVCDIIISGNLDTLVCDSEMIGGTWYRPSGITQPDMIGYTILQKTYLSKEAATILYFSLNDINTDKGAYNSVRDKWVGRGKSALIAILSFYFGELISKKALEKSIAAIISYAFGEVSSDMLPLDLTELEKNYIYEKGRFEIVKSHDQEVSLAGCGLELTYQATMRVSPYGGAVSQEINTTIKSWEDNSIKGIKYYRGLINNSEELLFYNLF